MATRYTWRVHVSFDRRESMHLQLRMQDAGWTADVERWQSDEDSDDSEDEQDADVQLSEAAILRLMA